MELLDPVSCMHVHSVCPYRTCCSTEVWASEHDQKRELFKKLLKCDESNQVKWFRENGCSPIRCPEATWVEGNRPSGADRTAHKPPASVLQETVVKVDDGKQPGSSSERGAVLRTPGKQRAHGALNEEDAKRLKICDNGGDDGPQSTSLDGGEHGGHSDPAAISKPSLKSSCGDRYGVVASGSCPHSNMENNNQNDTEWEVTDGVAHRGLPDSDPVSTEAAVSNVDALPSLQGQSREAEPGTRALLRPTKEARIPNPGRMPRGRKRADVKVQKSIKSFFERK